MTVSKILSTFTTTITTATTTTTNTNKCFDNRRIAPTNYVINSSTEKTESLSKFVGTVLQLSVHVLLYV